jgi:hypothetical protein
MLLGVMTVTWILANALLLQTGPHPAPIFATRAVFAPPHVNPPHANPLPVAQPPAKPSTDAVRPAPLPVNAVPIPTPAPLRKDSITAMLAPPRYVMAVQRALSDFGYGQIRPTGQFGPQTRIAIETFERQHRMPVTGQISEPLLRALSTMTGETLR